MNRRTVTTTLRDGPDGPEVVETVRTAQSHAELKRLAEAITDRKWRADLTANCRSFVVRGKNTVCRLAITKDSLVAEQGEAQARYIASAHPQAILSLIEENERMREALEYAHHALSAHPQGEGS